MVISSRTPDGWPNECPICGHSIAITPSPDTLDAPCPHCGHLLWFASNSCVIPLWQPSPNRADPAAQYEIPDEIQIYDYIAELIPHSVARENLVVAIADSPDALFVAAAVPVDAETIDKLQFILNRRVLLVPTTREWIEHQIKQCYGLGDNDTDAA